MGWRMVLIQNPAKLSVRQQQLVVTQDGQDQTVPLEDIASLVLDHRQITLSASVLTMSASLGVTIIGCGADHMPASLNTAFHPHSRQTLISRIQANWTTPFKKRAWQMIVRAKIQNQAWVLSQFGGDPHKLEGLIKRVESGDPQNIEAQAAQTYFPNLFGEAFVRRASCVQNSALNYGYAVVRACIGRAVVAYGFLPSLGLHHDGELNAFNLVDDLLEPFRPFVDRAVRHQFGRVTDQAADANLSAEDRAFLVNIANETVLLDGEVITIIAAAERIVQTLQAAQQAKKGELILCPVFAV